MNGFKSVVFCGLLLLAGNVAATGGGGGGVNAQSSGTGGGLVNPTATSTSVFGPASAAAAGAVSTSTASGVGQGGTGGSTGAITQENKAYGIGAPGLAASANACQGSVSIAVVGFTYTVEFCRALQEVTMMGALGLSKESMLNRLCQVDTIAATASECTGRKVQK